MDTSKTYLITGGSGYLGRALIKRLVKMGYKNLRVVSRNEGLLIALHEQYPFIDIITGDIASRFICEKACKDVDGIFHLAAFKHVGLAEKDVRECVYSNVMGSVNLIDQTIDKLPEFIVGISTDKAAKVNGIYGATKLIMERLFKEAEGINPNTQYRIVRYGNVLYSTGSVLCLWKNKLENGEQVIITDPDATRFYWTVDEAVDLIFRSLDECGDSTPLSTPMKAIRMKDLLEAMGEKYANGTYSSKQIGLQPGENKHEVITADGESSANVEKYTKEEIMKLI